VRRRQPRLLRRVVGPFVATPRRLRMPAARESKRRDAFRRRSPKPSASHAPNARAGSRHREEQNILRLLARSPSDPASNAKVLRRLAAQAHVEAGVVLPAYRYARTCRIAAEVGYGARRLRHQ